MGKKIERVVRPKRVPAYKTKVDEAGAIDAGIKAKQPRLKELKKELIEHADKFDKGTLIGEKFIATTGPTSTSDVDLDAVWEDIRVQVGLNISVAQHKKLDEAFEILKALVSPDTTALRKYYSSDEDAVLLGNILKVHTRSHGKIGFKEI